jgi:hypothetical protein
MSEITPHMFTKFIINIYTKIFRINLTPVCTDEVQQFSKLIWKSCLLIYLQKADFGPLSLHSLVVL